MLRDFTRFCRALHGAIAKTRLKFSVNSSHCKRVGFSLPDVSLKRTNNERASWASAHSTNPINESNKRILVRRILSRDRNSSSVV